MFNKKVQNKYGLPKTRTALPIILALILISISDSAVAGKSLTDCIKLAMNNGYGDEHCASLFIEACMTTTRKSELEAQLSFDMGSFGYGRSTMCGPSGNPNGKKYSKAWKQIFDAGDKW